eukprot:6767019-Prymnesium_polylepis.1
MESLRAAAAATTAPASVALLSARFFAATIASVLGSAVGSRPSRRSNGASNSRSAGLVMGPAAR